MKVRKPIAPEDRRLFCHFRRNRELNECIGDDALVEKENACIKS
jgi:hypothetical protein